MVTVKLPASPLWNETGHPTTLAPSIQRMREIVPAPSASDEASSKNPTRTARCPFSPLQKWTEATRSNPSSDSSHSGVSTAISSESPRSMPPSNRSPRIALAERATPSPFTQATVAAVAVETAWRAGASFFFFRSALEPAGKRHLHISEYLSSCPSRQIRHKH